MSDFPVLAGAPNGPSISTYDPECDAGSVAGDYLKLAGASTAWGTNNLAIYVPVRIEQPFTVARMGIHNAATLSGTIDLGIYNFTGTRIASSTAVTQTGVSVNQLFTVTATLTPGVYYFAMGCSSTTSTTFMINHGSTPLARACGVRSEAAASTLPATATFANPTTGRIPFIWASPRTT